MTYKNPFVVYSPEYIAPENFRGTFVKENTYINGLESPNDVFVKGVRGSGKSTLLHYLEFSHRLYFCDNDLKKYFEETQNNPFVGVYIHIVDDLLGTTRYSLLEKNQLVESHNVQMLCMTDLISTIVHKSIQAFLSAKPMVERIRSLDTEPFRDFYGRITSNIFRDNGTGYRLPDEVENSEILNVLSEVFQKNRREITFYSYDKFQMKDCRYQGFHLEQLLLFEFVKGLKKILNLDDCAIYLLFDNAEDATKQMQICINELVKSRNHKDICIKLAIKSGAHWDLNGIQWPHDYSQIDIDELYSTNHTVYYKRVKEIAQKRLDIAGFQGVTIEDFLPPSKDEEDLLNKIKARLKETFKQEYKEKLSQQIELPPEAEFISNRVNKYAQAELFRELKRRSKSYAGFENIAHLSSGIIRQFLDICSKMYDEEVKSNSSTEMIKRISLSCQNRVIKDYADEFIDALYNTAQGFQEQGDTEKAKKCYHLHSLIEALGKNYKRRLLMENMREPRVFTFTLKDEDKDPYIIELLNVGVYENYFQRYWYSSKSGIGKYNGYVFNRRLCPRYGIDHTSFRGRIELTALVLRNAIETGEIENKSNVCSTTQTTLM